jgi:hypothetical protein
LKPKKIITNFNLGFVRKFWLKRFRNIGSRVQYPGTPEINFRWTINPKALSKVMAAAAVRCFVAENQGGQMSL